MCPSVLEKSPCDQPYEANHDYNNKQSKYLQYEVKMRITSC